MFRAKVGVSNIASISLFKNKLNFKEVSECVLSMEEEVSLYCVRSMENSLRGSVLSKRWL